MTEKEIQKLKDKLSEKEVDLDDISIKDLKMDEMYPQEFNGNVVTIIDGYHHIFLNASMDKHKFKTFRKNPGGIFSKDLLKYSRKKDHGKYLLVEGKGERKIVRLIEDDEITLFQSIKLIKGMIKDKPYMLLRNLAPDEKIISTSRYINENSEHEDDENVMSVAPRSIEMEDDYDTNTSSVSLFDE